MIVKKAIYLILSGLIRKTRRHNYYYYFMSTAVDVIPMQFFVVKLVDSIDDKIISVAVPTLYKSVVLKTAIKDQIVFLLVGILNSNIKSEIYKSYTRINGETYKIQSKPPIYFSYMKYIIKLDEEDFIIDKETTKLFNNCDSRLDILDNQLLFDISNLDNPQWW